MATGVVGVAGIFGTWITGKQGRDHAERVATEKLQHDRELAREARVQQRKETAYVALLEMVERTGQWVFSVLPMIEPGPELKLPEFDEQARIEALVNAFGSMEVRDLMKNWRSHVRKVISQVNLIHVLEKHPTANDPEQRPPRLTLDDLREQERTARETLSAQVATELTHIAADPTEPEAKSPPRGVRARLTSLMFTS